MRNAVVSKFKEQYRKHINLVKMRNINKKTSIVFQKNVFDPKICGVSGLSLNCFQKNLFDPQICGVSGLSLEVLHIFFRGVTYISMQFLINSGQNCCMPKYP